MKKLLFLIQSVLFLSCCSCSMSHCNLAKYVGLYEVVDSECECSEGLDNPCRDIRFIEPVEGTFHGIASDQIGLVLWRAEFPDAKVGSLLYTARRVAGHDRLPQEGKTIWLENREYGQKEPAQRFVAWEKEYFVVKDGVLSEYHFILDRENKETGQVFKRRFHYKITPAAHDDFKAHEFLYP